MDEPFSIALSIPNDLYRIAPEYGGEVDGTNELTGETLIDFPTYKAMADFVEGNGLESRTRMVTTPNYYQGWVTISVSVAPW